MSKSSRSLMKFLQNQPVAPLKSSQPSATPPPSGSSLRTTFGLPAPGTTPTTPPSATKGLLSELREKAAKWDEVQTELDELRANAQDAEDMGEELEELTRTRDALRQERDAARLALTTATASVDALKANLYLALGALLGRGGDMEGVTTAIRGCLAKLT